MIGSERVGDVGPAMGDDVDLVMPEGPVDDAVREESLMGNGAARVIDEKLNLEHFLVPDPRSPESQGG